MTPEAQQIAIAEACGYADFGHMDIGLGDTLCAMVGPDQEAMSPLCVPNYLSDLNAMHEAEKVLTEEQQQEYFYQLNDVVGLVEPFSPTWIKEFAIFAIAHATAAQRAEAFLRTLNLWDDTK